MRLPILLAGILVLAGALRAEAAEGSSVAGPIGGTDMRSAQLPPPGVYGGTLHLLAEGHDFYDGKGEAIPALNDLALIRQRNAAFIGWVPPVDVLGGAVGLVAVLPGGVECGRATLATDKDCIGGFGDPYLEVTWSRSFARLRPSEFAGALPIAEGLTVAAGFGMVVPAGRWHLDEATRQGLVIGNNLWDFAPHVAVTYMTPPILAEGTEFSAKLYWNNYLTNPATQYTTSSILDVDFALTERIGRVQLGVAGYYAFSLGDDYDHGVRVLPDGRRGAALALGPVVAVDMPEHQATLKLKAVTTLISENTLGSTGALIGWVRKF